MGLSYDSNTNKFDLDPTLFAGAVAGALIPELQGAFQGVFALQPDIGLPFNSTNNTLDYNELTIEPSGGGGGSFTRPLVPVVTTYTVDYDLDLPSTETMPADLAPSVSTVNDLGYDVLNGLEMIPILGVLCLFGLLVWALF